MLVSIVFAVGLLLIKALWAWTVPDLFPGAVQQGLIAGEISWSTAAKVALFLAVLSGIVGVRDFRYHNQKTGIHIEGKVQQPRTTTFMRLGCRLWPYCPAAVPRKDACSRLLSSRVNVLFSLSSRDTLAFSAGNASGIGRLLP